MPTYDLFVYREMDMKSFMQTVIDSAALAGMVLFILAAASAFSWALTIAYVPQRLVLLLCRDALDIRACLP